MVQPQSNGVAEISGLGRICPEPEGQRRAWRAHSKCMLYYWVFFLFKDLKKSSFPVDAGASV